MSNIIKSYPVFESSQILTSTQLNKLVSYLDQQNRLTRVKLIGMGIVCGLELEYDDGGSSTEIAISKGTAITSEGFILTVGECITSYFRPYNLPEGVEYKPFGNPDQDVTLFELLKEIPEDPAGVEAISDFDTATDLELDDMFVLLFLECFDNDLKSCLGKTCDELGLDRIFTIRKLLISRDDLDLVLTRSDNVGGLFPEKFDLPDIVMPRVLFDPAQLHSQEYTEFLENFRDAFNTEVYAQLFGGISNDGALSETYNIYEPLMGSLYDFSDPFQSAEVVALKNTWKGFIEGTSSPGTTYLGMQYFYDFLKDLILAYNEFKSTAFDLMAECCPDMSLFPKHVMLGKAISTNETAEERDKYRHKFSQPPIYNNQKYLLEKTIALHKRMVLMVEKFNLDLINNPDNGEEGVQVRITPSCEKKSLLSDRAIPYYYKIHEPSATISDGNLEYYWDFDKTRTKSAGTTPLVLSYQNQNEDQTVGDVPLTTPLYYDIDDYPFLRIEGYIGKNFQDVLSTINSIKHNFDLPFEVIALQLDPNADNVELDYSCGFEDIQEDYLIHKKIFCSTIEDIVRLYDYVEENQGSVFDGEDGEEDQELLKEIVDQLQNLCEISDCIHEFDFMKFRENYKNVLQLIIDFVLIHKELLNEIDADNEEDLKLINGFIQHLSPIIYKFIDLIFYYKFYRVYFAFKRREYYLQKETAVFSRYITKNPGIQHQAGVYQGGTFIIVYNGGEDNTTIADFNLPYLCCGPNNCIPACDDDFVFDLPPFARPDYAITNVDTPVEIDVLINDDEPVQNEYIIEHDQETENDGKVESLSEKGPLIYTPKEGYTGIDTFTYKLINKDTNDEDTATVTILIKEITCGCYTREVMFCWGVERVQFALEVRKIDFSDMSEDEMVGALLNSLCDTGGFTEEEIRFNILESRQHREDLLNCLEIPFDSSTSYEELGQLIMDYQAENCDAGDDGQCTVTSVTGFVTDRFTGEPVSTATIAIKNGTSNVQAQEDGSYQIGLEEVGQTLVYRASGYELAEVDVCNEPNIDVSLIPVNRIREEVDVNLELIPNRELINIAREISRCPILSVMISL